MDDQLTGRFKVITDPEDVSDDQLVGRIALVNEDGDLINPISGPEGKTKIDVITQEDYDLLDPPDPATLYIIQG